MMSKHEVETAWLARAVFSALGLLPLLGAAACSGQVQTNPQGGVGGSGGGGDGGGAGGGGHPVVCQHPIKVSAGLERCGEGGPVHRTASEECSGADTSGVAQPCLADADCDADKLCHCGSQGGFCQIAYCRTDADCMDSLRCQILDSNSCSSPVFACQTPQDTCQSDADCPGTVPAGGGSPGFMASQYCGTYGQDGFSCKAATCTVGRPFLVEDAARLAAVCERTDWRADGTELELQQFSSVVREAAAEGWLAIARMEHASIAAFARFGLQLLSLGAPPSLIEQNTAAMADETRHARRAFAIASQLAGCALGPGPLAIDGSLEAATLFDVLRLVFREGCVGETAAALEARQAAEHAREPLLKQTLLTIAEDETRHAQLAWQFVSWALGLDSDAVRDVLRAELERALAFTEPVAHADEDLHTDALNQLGLVSSSQRAALRRLALVDVIAPCVEQLLVPRASAPYAQFGKPGTSSLAL